MPKPYMLPSAASSRSRNTACPFRIFLRASSSVNQAARSSSGNSCRRPDFGGHSISKLLLRSFAASQSSSTAQA